MIRQNIYVPLHVYTYKKAANVSSDLSLCWVNSVNFWRYFKTLYEVKCTIFNSKLINFLTLVSECGHVACMTFKNFCSIHQDLTPKNNFSNEKNFHAWLKELIAWLTQKNKFLPKKFLILNQKNQNFSKEKKFHTPLKELIFYPKKKFLTLNWRNNQFLMITRKNSFPNKKNFLSKKRISYTCGKLKQFISDVLWIWLCYFFF